MQTLASPMIPVMLCGQEQKQLQPNAAKSKRGTSQMGGQSKAVTAQALLVMLLLQSHVHYVHHLNAVLQH